MDGCKKCGSVGVFQHSELELVNRNNIERLIDIEYSSCGSCFREFLTKSQIISNELKVRSEFASGIKE